jgi:hypothetical protein
MSVEYCSRACQKLHWAAHKAACKVPSRAQGRLQGPEPGEQDMKETDAYGLEFFDVEIAACLSVVSLEA